jgi:hypothetical protein
MVAPLAIYAQTPPPPAATEIVVAPDGNDANPGTAAQPLATLAAAQQRARSAPKSQPVRVRLRGGTYRLAQPLVFTSADSGSAAAPVSYEAFSAADVPVISGGVLLPAPKWTAYKDGILQTPVPADWITDQLFVNGQAQILARYPNFDPAVANFNGFAADAISPERVARWADPAGGFIHALHGSRWGGLSYRITGKNADGTLAYEGGWQTNRASGMNKKVLFVEGIFEELDAPGEWFLNHATHTLYYYPPAGVSLDGAVVEGVCPANLVEFRGTDKDPVRFVTLQGLTFTQAARTFMQTREPLLRTDWAIYRGGALLFNGAEDCAVVGCTLQQLGGNAIFVNAYNRRVAIRRCHLHAIGASGCSFVGDTKAVRSPLFEYGKRQSLSGLDATPGPLTDNYPADCTVEDCLIHDTGTVEKQSAPVEIDIADSIMVRHCSIYRCPRAGINIGDGCFGGHVVDGCDIFDTVRETGDHGSFNSWGRDRWWGLGGVNLDKDIAGAHADLPFLDCVKPITLTNSRWRCDHGWDIDLDDGSSHYVITNNLCLSGGIKNREGFVRRVENNIMVNAPFCPHVWFTDSGDIVQHNILEGYHPAGMKAPPWGERMDYNFFTKPGQSTPVPAEAFAKQSGGDAHSLVGDPQFVDPATGNYQVGPNSPALALGFKNFPMDQFGVQDPKLKALALTPQFPAWGGTEPVARGRDQTPLAWNGATVRNLKDENEMSVYGVPGITGVVVTSVDASSVLAAAGLAANDVILSVNGGEIGSIDDLKKIAALGKPFTVGISRAQNPITLKSK